MANITVGYDAAGSALDYTTMASAYAAATEYDTLIPYYYNTTKRRYWLEVLSAIGNTASKMINITGGLPGQQVIFRERLTTALTASGDLSGKSKVTWENFSVIGPHSTSQYAIEVSNGGASAGGGVDIKRLRVMGGLYGIAAIGTTGTVQNCAVVFCYSHGIYNTHAGGIGGTVGMYFNTAVGNRGYGIFNNNNSSGVLKNNFALWNQPYDIAQSASNGGCDYNAGWSWQYTAGANALTGQTMDDVEVMLLNANSFYPWDFRVTTSGSVVGSGLAIAGITEDIDAQTRADPPTIGASEGVSSFGSGGGRRTRGRYHAI